MPTNRIKVLIIDDEKDLADSILEYLQYLQFDCVVCYDPTEALELIKNNPYDIVFSDLKMPQLSGLELFEKIKDLDLENAPKFVLMSGHLNIADAKDYYTVGIDEVITKPFDMDDVVTITNLLLKNTFIDDGTHQFFSLNIADFINTTLKNYDIYIKISDKFICLAKKTQTLSPLRLKQLMLRGVEHIYLNFEDYCSYLDINFLSDSSCSLTKLSLQKRQKLVTGTVQLVSDNYLAQAIDPQYLKKSLGNFEAYCSTLLRNDYCFEIFRDLHENHPNLFLRSVLVSTLASSVALVWGWSNPKIQSKLILSALMCDVGLRETPDLIGKNKSEFSQEEIHAYEQHPTKSLKILEALPGAPSEILLVAQQHHENSSGMGFPYKIKKSKLHPYSRIIHTISEFVEARVNYQNKDDIKNELDQMSQKKYIYSEQVIKTLYMLFQIEKPKAIDKMPLPNSTTFLI